MIYLDHNSSTYVLQRIREAVDERAEFLSYNPNSPHAAGRIARSYVEEARAQIAELVGVRSKNVVFTSGATEANHIALASYKNSSSVILALATEHPSVREHATSLIAVHEDGTVDLGDLNSQIDKYMWYGDTTFACMFANNETGVISDPELAALRVCQQRGIKMHIDASQCYGKGFSLPADLVSYASTITMSGYKMHSLKGVGVLIFRDEVAAILKPVFKGGHQELGLRPGTPSVEAIFSMGMAASTVPDLDYDEMFRKKHYIIEQLSDISILNGGSAPKLQNTVNLSFPTVKDNHLLIEILSSKGVMVSGTSACKSGLNTASHVLEAMYGKDSSRPNSSLRISLSTTTSWDDIVAAAKIIRDSVTAT